MPEFTRPAPTWEAPEGYEHVAVEAGPEWKPEAGRPCRRLTGHWEYCGAPAIAVLYRAYRMRPRRQGWPYCAAHAYGKWVEDGKVMMWIMREKTDD